jgi:hypothetical protein
MRNLRRGLALAAACIVSAAAAHAAEAQTSVSAAVRAALQAKAGPRYPLGNVTIVAGDSAVIEFADSTYTGEARAARKWMFGPPVPIAEQDSCPPEKILGRKIARVLWQNGGKAAKVQKVVVVVHGTIGKDRWSRTDFYYEPSQLDGPWAGDPASLPQKAR